MIFVAQSSIITVRISYAYHPVSFHHEKICGFLLNQILKISNTALPNEPVPPVINKVLFLNINLLLAKLEKVVSRSVSES